MLLLTLPAVVRAQTYQTLDDPLGVPNTASSTFAFGISGGNIVGSAGPNILGFLYNGSLAAVEVPPSDYYTQTFTVATGISGNAIVGWYTEGADDHGFLYKDGNYTTLDYPNAGVFDNRPCLPPGGYDLLVYESQFETYGGTFGSSISGENIVGWYHDTNGATHNFLYNGTTYTTLDDPKGIGATWAQGINGSNIVGWYYDTNNEVHGFLYNRNTYTTLDAPEGVGSTRA